ncbi:hypothetical protein AAG906_020781 [Vitis piasezkii]
MLDLQFVFPKIERRFHIPECFPRFRPKNALILSSSGNALILSSSGVSWPSDFRCKRWSFSSLSIHWCRRSPPDLGSTQDEAKAPQPESVLNIRYGIAGNRTIGAHRHRGTLDRWFYIGFNLECSCFIETVIDPCLAAWTPVFLWYLGFNFESMITLKLSHAIFQCKFENWMIVGRKRGHVSLSTKQVISILCMPRWPIHTSPKLGLPNVDEANISCNLLAPQCVLKLTTIISFFYGHYGGDRECAINSYQRAFSRLGIMRGPIHRLDAQEKEVYIPLLLVTRAMQRQMTFEAKVPDTPIRHPPIIGARMEELLLSAILDSTRWRIAWIIIERLHISVRCRDLSIEERMDQRGYA